MTLQFTFCMQLAMSPIEFRRLYSCRYGAGHSVASVCPRSKRKWLELSAPKSVGPWHALSLRSKGMILTLSLWLGF